jgi:hypothetical protein
MERALYTIFPDFQGLEQATVLTTSTTTTTTTTDQDNDDDGEVLAVTMHRSSPTNPTIRETETGVDSTTNDTTITTTTFAPGNGFRPSFAGNQIYTNVQTILDCATISRPRRRKKHEKYRTTKSDKSTKSSKSYEDGSDGGKSSKKSTKGDDDDDDDKDGALHIGGDHGGKSSKSDSGGKSSTKGDDDDDDDNDIDHGSSGDHGDKSSESDSSGKSSNNSNKGGDDDDHGSREEHGDNDDDESSDQQSPSLEPTDPQSPTQEPTEEPHPTLEPTDERSPTQEPTVPQTSDTTQPGEDNLATSPSSLVDYPLAGNDDEEGADSSSATESQGPTSSPPDGTDSETVSIPTRCFVDADDNNDEDSLDDEEGVNDYFIGRLENPPCSVCGDEDQTVTVYHAFFEWPGQPRTTCGLLQIAGAMGHLPADYCSLLPDLIREKCRCQPIPTAGKHRATL